MGGLPRSKSAGERIVAPFDCVVVQIYVRLGEWGRAWPEGAPRLSASIDSKPKATCPAQGRPAAGLAGAPARLTVDLPGQPGATFDGKVVFVSPEIDPITSQVPRLGRSRQTTTAASAPAKQ